MKTFTIISFPNGLVYQLQTQAIADHMAAAGVVSEADAGDDAYTSWLKQHMTWADVAPFVRLVDARTDDPAEQFALAVASLSDTETIATLPTDATILLKPTELLIYSMAREGRTANVLFIETGPEPTSYKLAFNLVQGPKQIVDGYIGVAQEFTQFLLQQANEQAAAEDKSEGTSLPQG